MNVIKLIRFYPDDNKDTITRKRQHVAQILTSSRVKLIKLGCDWWFVKETEDGKAK